MMRVLKYDSTEELFENLEICRSPKEKCQMRTNGECRTLMGEDDMKPETLMQLLEKHVEMLLACMYYADATKC